MESDLANAPKGNEPTGEEIEELIEAEPNHSYYTAREKLREKAYGGKPPGGHGSWGDYWKQY